MFFGYERLKRKVGRGSEIKNFSHFKKFSVDVDMYLWRCFGETTRCSESHKNHFTHLTTSPRGKLPGVGGGDISVKISESMLSLIKAYFSVLSYVEANMPPKCDFS